jgi:hypothetical protein
MPNADISRYLNQPRKHYAGARLQQARALLDSDFNEGAEARGEDLRAALLDIVGAVGTRDDGFLPALKVGDLVASELVRFGTATQAQVLDYRLRPGTLYVGGAQWEQNESEPVVFQREFLQMGAATAPRAAFGLQHQLSYLRAWEQPVTAVEDEELIEPALGGADAAARVRRLRRVEVRNVQATDCASAFAEVLEDLGGGDTGTYDPATCELRSNARMQMTFEGEPGGECGPCRPSLEGRYLGGEANAVRVMLAGPDSYVWAFDNAAPLYRVRLILDGGGGARVEVLTPPKDTYHYPRQHSVVEFLPWEALLENGKPQGGKITGETVRNERVAARVGLFAEADGPYDASKQTFHVHFAPGSAPQISSDAGTGKGQPNQTNTKGQPQPNPTPKSDSAPAQDGVALRWDAQHPFANQLNTTENSPDGFVAYFYMRVWHVRQPDTAITIPTSSNKPLGQTGLLPVFTGRGRAGDFWTVAVRAEAPDEILPREIMRAGGEPPHGPREVVAALCLLSWFSANGTSHELVGFDDCRPTLPALTERACCTFEVGPGGDFETIQAAVDALPRGGGRICVRPGVYDEEIVVEGRSNVLITGCGERTLIRSPAGASDDALVRIELGDGQSNVVLRDLSISATAQVGVLAEGGRGVELRGLRVEAGPGKSSGLRSAVQVVGTGDVRITRCRIVSAGSFSQHAAVYLDAPDGALFEGNTVETLGDQTNGLCYAWGGVHVAGGSREVEIRDNVIRGGRGYGVTLGSASFSAPDGTRLGIEGAGRGQSNPAPPFALRGVITPVSANPDGKGSRDYFPEPGPPVEEILICGNQIEGAGGSGISSLALQVELEDDWKKPPLCFRRTTFVLSDLVIEDNRVIGNALQKASGAGESAAVGGIVLSDARRATVRANLVEGNGAETDAPVCGICVARGEHVSIVANRVRGNGATASGAAALAEANRRLRGGEVVGSFGPRFQGGIVVAPPVSAKPPDVLNEDAARNVHIRRNIVEQTDAVALHVRSRGACRVNGNFFQSRPSGESMLGPTVLVVSAGKPWEAVDLPQGEPNPDRWLQPNMSLEFLNGRAQELPDGDGGALCFNGNQITTNGTSIPPEGGFGAWLFSLDHVTAVGNQFAARSVNPFPRPHVMVVGVTADFSVNRVAESVVQTDVSLGEMGVMLTACAGNMLTHCPAVFGCVNDQNPDFFVAEDNLVWFRPPSGRCEGAARLTLASLQNLCGSFFNRNPTVVTNPIIIRR